MFLTVLSKVCKNILFSYTLCLKKMKKCRRLKNVAGRNVAFKKNVLLRP